MATHLTKTATQTRALGKQLAKQLTGGQILGLKGDLGSGKTTFVKGLAKGLNIKNTITSPTFVLFKIYPIKHRTIKRLVHVDCYRVSGKELSLVGLDEYLNDPQTIVAIEWPNKIKNQPNWLTIKFTAVKNSNHRKIQLPKKLAI
ncbi:tRNA (adenosine(37)-N6)-threonylcarbamoyltransferase complex ATPase subunit type 1 TsaE [Patescibacteria group bacterium]|nr:tRNA (adenosine(37)-N6)-threonylcarbamoyltransferase complex ATPase subunit type 1 TsaE [Patescibacteria group bacterium]